jgi:hypothetical protein
MFLAAPPFNYNCLSVGRFSQLPVLAGLASCTLNGKKTRLPTGKLVNGVTGQPNYLPLNTGLRFSLKAARPSRRSSVGIHTQ